MVTSALDIFSIDALGECATGFLEEPTSCGFGDGDGVPWLLGLLVARKSEADWMNASQGMLISES